MEGYLTRQPNKLLNFVKQRRKESIERAIFMY